MNSKILFAIALVGLLGCASSKATDEKMYSLAAALTKLSAAAEGVVRYEDEHSGLADRELLELTTAYDPSLLQPFAGYHLRAQVSNRHVVVLVCTPESDRALLEDAGCSANLDIHHWKAAVAKLCRFELKVEEACS